MTKRKGITASIIDSDGRLVESRIKYAWNSAIRETEALLREYGRTRGTALTGGTPEATRDVTGREYRRTWTTAGGEVLRAVVREDW